MRSAVRGNKGLVGTCMWTDGRLASGESFIFAERPTDEIAASGLHLAGRDR